MSIYKIYDQATGKVVENGATANPIVVELNTERVNIKNILKDGNDLIVTLDLFHKSKNDLFLANYLYRRILNIHA